MNTGKTDPPKPLDMEARDTFLAHFEEKRRSQVTNQFLDGARLGRSASSIVQHVAAINRLRKMRPYDAGDLANTLRILEVLEEFPEQSLAFAAYARQWVALPEAERTKIKRARSAGYVESYMASSAPTDAQMRYIESLGHRGESPATKAEASRLIESLKARKQGAAA